MSTTPKTRGKDKLPRAARGFKTGGRPPSGEDETPRIHVTYVRLTGDVYEFMTDQPGSMGAITDLAVRRLPQFKSWLKARGE